MQAIRVPFPLVALSLIAAIAVGMIAYHFAFSDANANSHDSAGEVRVATRSLDDGRVEVAVQQRAADADWGDRHLPDARFLPADVEPNVWRVSSGVPISAADAASGPLYCMIGHGDPTDTFWREVRGYARVAADRFGMNLRFSTHQDSADQAAAVTQCSTDGALAIASTIADPDQLVPALQAASEAGARIVTFNSGSAYAEDARSTLHIGLNDAKVGETAAQQFNELETSGLLLCVIHEATNVGLNERCDSLAAHYEGGEVEVLQLSGDDDIEARAEKIAARLSDADAAPVAGMFLLNPDTLVAGLTAIERTESTLEVMSVAADERNRAFPDWVKHQRSISIADLAEFQGYLTVATLMMMADFHHPADFILSPALFIGEPNVNDARAWLQDSDEANEASEAGQRIRAGDGDE